MMSDVANEYVYHVTTTITLKTLYESLNNMAQYLEHRGVAVERMVLNFIHVFDITVELIVGVIIYLKYVQSFLLQHRFAEHYMLA